ncbi:beta-lactamase family protein [Mobilitalea sibirica]|uniref:Beta-lactamase family protein n=1 Tax=Mobilitalea sibirica TaxID=1462919 RepID=A0A8J7HDP9_9FIRM|nr:serine hydrolase domain-containing protein [Mobilitalea sibirica]MBH1941029.1 beta-lactamase family protein [Mobilitalea sibirica]
MLSFETKYKPEEVGYDPARLEVVTKHFEDMIAQKKIIAANYCMARDGKVFADIAVGKLSFRQEDIREHRPDTIQRIASITKLFTTVAIWQLVENGKLRVNQRVGEIIDEFNEKPFYDITIAHLLTHTSGLHPDPGCFENKYFQSPWDFIVEDKGKNWIAAALKSGMRMKPGQEWAYCSFGFVILGEIITRVSKEFANDYITEHIIKPCGLKDTGFDFLRPEIIARTNIPNERREKAINEILAGTFEDDREEFWDKIPQTGGAIYSTASDLCKFGTMLQQGGYIDGVRILGRKAIEKMTTLYTAPHIKDYCWNAGGVYREYGLGPDMRCTDMCIYSKGTYFHEGSGGCALIIDPVEKLVVAFFIPFVDDVWSPEPLYNAAAVMWAGLI